MVGNFTWEFKLKAFFSTKPNFLQRLQYFLLLYNKTSEAAV